MGNYLGSGVSRVLDPTSTGYTEVVWQEGKPPCDAELNLSQEIASDWSRKIIMRGTPSGWLGNDANASADFATSSIWSNWFKFGRQASGEKRAVQWANVNGWVIPVTGTRTGAPPGSPNDTDTWNLIALDPPPANTGDFRVDFAFLEVWLARVPPNPATTNKPGAAYIYKYGNVEGGASFLADDLVDPALGFDTTQRVQLQYRIRVVRGLVGLASYPDGFDAAVVKAQGAATAATSYSFTNMRRELGDAGLWRAGDGTQNALGSVDGYVYAIPICGVFRRNSVAWTGDPSPNTNGGFNRNPTAVDRTGIKTFSVSGSVGDTVPVAPILTAVVTASATSMTVGPLVQVAFFPFPASPASPVLIKVGDELMTYSAVTSGGVMTVTRGVNGTRAESHAVGTAVTILSGRPDGLFSDQIAATDILDMRHVVNPNGFDYTALLKGNLDKLLRGKLRANWKRTGYGPQGPFLPYQDKIGVSAASGVTLLDAPDNIRLIFSDVASVQRVPYIALPGTGTLPEEIGVPWGLGGPSIQHTSRLNPSQFSVTDVITIPILPLKTGLPGGDADQVRFSNDPGAVELRFDGETNPINPSTYTVTPANPGPNDDLVITCGAGFPGGLFPAPKQLYVTVSVIYGPGRGLSRRPDAIHSVVLSNAGSDIMTHHSGVVSTNFPLRVGWAPLWSKFRNTTYRNSLPVTAEAYADLGSKTLALQPFRRIAWPSLYTQDGTAANYVTTAHLTSGTGLADGSSTFTDASVNFTTSCQQGDALIITNGGQPGRYTITAPPGVHTVVLDRNVLDSITPTLQYTVHRAQGLMPLLKRDGVTPKWTTTDPLEVFSGTTETNAPTKNICVTLPRHLVPGWGEFKLPIVTTYDESQNSTFAEGINFGLISLKGTTYSAGDKNYVPYGYNGSFSFARFTTWNFTGATPATYNAAVSVAGGTMAGIRKFTDARGLGRKGLELPPFYGIARLFGVYESQDYATSSLAGAYNPFNRNPQTGFATNLLRQDFDGPLFWIELDSDGDSTFVLNADALDLSHSPNPITFDTGNFVIDASIFGFDRDAFDITKEFRLVLSRSISTSTSRGEAISGTRSANIDTVISGPSCVLPGPVGTGGAVCSVLINYSRTPYMGDAFGSQTSYSDLSYKPGPLVTGNAFQVSSTTLNIDGLTRPNQKVLEVLASCGFITTLGTGRLSGDVSATAIDMRNAGYEDPTVYPPVTNTTPRPVTHLAEFTLDTDVFDPDTDYLGCTERLPLGALYRDKDFRGGTFGWNSKDALLYTEELGVGAGASLSRSHLAEHTSINLSTAGFSSGRPGEFVVHVDGEQGNYSLLTNFRTNRGGSLFAASGDHPGGEVGAIYRNVSPPWNHTNVLAGRAYLVRNTTTMVGAVEVSAGDELMLLVTTTVIQVSNPGTQAVPALIGTNGTGEGWSASDLYRIEGRPLMNDNVRAEIDPSAITLSRPLRIV